MGTWTRVLPYLWDSPPVILAMYVGRVHWLLGLMLGLQIILLSPLRPYGELRVAAHIYLLLPTLCAWRCLGKEGCPLFSIPSL